MSQDESKGVESLFFSKYVGVAHMHVYFCLYLALPVARNRLPTIPVLAHMLRILFHARSYQLSLSFCSLRQGCCNHLLIADFFFLKLLLTPSVRSNTGRTNHQRQ